MLAVWAWEAKKGADRKLMAHLQMTKHTPSTHTNRQKRCGLRSCCFTATAARATTVSLPQSAEKRNARECLRECV